MASPTESVRMQMAQFGMELWHASPMRARARACNSVASTLKRRLTTARTGNQVIKAAPNYPLSSASEKKPLSPLPRASSPSSGPPLDLTITPLEVLALPVLKFSGRVLVLTSREDEREHADLLRRHFLNASPETIIGFDSEAKPALFGRKNRTAVLQLATRELCALWRNPYFVRSRGPRVVTTSSTAPEDQTRRTADSSSLSRNETGEEQVRRDYSDQTDSKIFDFPLLTKILESDKICKVTQGASGELEQLSQEFGIEGQRFVCLFELAHYLQTNPRSLQGLVGIFLRHRLKKDLRCSNWELESLSKAQLEYAACDAFASHAVLERVRLQHTGSPKISCQFERVFGSSSGGAAVRKGKTSHFNKTGSTPGVPEGDGGLQNNEHPNPTRPEARMDAIFAGPTGGAGTSLQGFEGSSGGCSGGGDTLQQLTQLCLRKNLRLRSEGFELGESNRGFRASFSIQGRLFQSKQAHASIREAQRDCAAVILEHLRLNIV
ncbi:unnamed protein product [Amoebophrya sp. A120]|nr:unnamed protein product [Amoebophrya sp. A120]|eukprot:GSA120T00017916001.1